MRVGTIKILLAVLCLAGTFAMSGQTSDVHAVQKVTEPQTDTLAAAPHLLKQIKAAPVPGINGPQDVSLGKDESLKFLERFDRLRESEPLAHLPPHHGARYADEPVQVGRPQYHGPIPQNLKHDFRMERLAVDDRPVQVE